MGAFSAALLVIVLAGGDHLGPPQYHARFYERGSNRKTLLFTGEGYLQRQGNVRMERQVFRDPKGTELATEEAVYVDGRLKTYKLDMPQLNGSGSVEIADKVRMTWTQDGKTKKSDEDLGLDIVVGPGLEEFIKTHWAELLKGDTLKVRFPVVERGETFGFKLYKDRELKFDGHDCVTIIMKPTNIFVAMAVDPTTFIATKDGQYILSVLGHTTPKVKVKDEWKECDAEAVFGP
jgi:hypothetical protein